MQLRQRQSINVTIGDTTYVIRQMGARQGREIWAILAAALSGGLTELQDMDSIAGAGLGDLGKAIKGALNALSRDDLNMVCDVLADHTAVVAGNGQLELSLMYDDHFAGRYMEMGKWIMEALKANFADFFTEFKTMMVAKNPDAQ